MAAYAAVMYGPMPRRRDGRMLGPRSPAGASTGEGSVHGLHQLVIDLGQQVAVPVDSGGDALMAHPALDRGK
jgi:hypothetical protein